MEYKPQIQNKTYKYFLIGFFIILFLPLLSIQPWFSPPDWGKTVVLRVVFPILIFLFIREILFFRNNNIILKAKNLLKNNARFVFWLLISLAGIVLLSTIFSPDPHHSFFASPFRSGGSLNFIFYIVFTILLFLIARKKDWKKLWFFSIIIGLLVSFIAFIQFFHFFSSIIIPYTVEIPSTIGGPIFLGIYLLLLSFPTLSFALTEENFKKKIFYFASFFIFGIVLLMSNSQAAYLGFGAGFVYFLLFYPKKLVLFKGLILVLIISAAFGFFFLRANAESSLIKKPIIRNLVVWKVDQSRLSSWKVSLQALKDRPILGYGLENFSIPFDKYYDPSLPAIKRQPGGAVTGWWDRAHNVFLELALTIGFPGLIIYLLIFTFLFFQLRKVKKKNPKHALFCNAIQASFVGYFTANFFSFDTCSTYIVLFLIIGYSLHLISQNQNPEKINNNVVENIRPSKWLDKILKYKTLISFFLLIILIWCVWITALKPIRINKEINLAVHYSNPGVKKCQQAMNTMEQILPSHSIIDSYLRLRYVDILRTCMFQFPKQKAEFAMKATQILEKAKDLRPTYTRTWLFFGSYANIFVEANLDIDSEVKHELLKKADSSLQKAYELSPKRQEVWVTWIKTNLLATNYEAAKQKAQQCIDMNPDLPNCWWGKGLAHIYLNEIGQALENMEIAVEKGYDNRSHNSIIQLLNAYLMIQDKDRDCYIRLAELYESLIEYDRNNFQYHASLSYVYKELGEYEKAVEEAIKVFVLSPKSMINVEEFLKTLPIDNNFYQTIAGVYEELVIKEPGNFQHHTSLAFIYKQLGEYEKAAKEAIQVFALSLDSITVKEFLSILPIDNNFYQTMAEVYKELVIKEPKKLEHHVSLAFIYKQLGEYEKVRQEAAIILELWPSNAYMAQILLEDLP